MPLYAYKGVNQDGRRIRGLLEAESARAARARLRREGIHLTSLEEGAERLAKPSGTRTPLAFLQRRSVSRLELALATRQLATLVGAGIPLLEALTALREQVESTRLAALVGRARDRLSEGASLADALEETGAFPGLYVNLVRAGEASGALETVLGRLADYLESQVRLRDKVVSILIYPAVLFGFACVAVAVLVTFVLPQITQLLVSLGRPLPLYTRVVIAVADFARGGWWAIGLALLALAAALRTAARSEAGRLVIDRALLRLPLLGRVVRRLAIARFTRTLATLLAGGLPIVRALDIAAAVANNRVLARAVENARQSLTEGASLAAPLRASGEFPPLVVHMVDVGERSGELEAMLEKVAQSYEEQVEVAVGRMTALLEPLLLAVMIGIVVTIILATLVPLLQITSSLG